MNLADGLSIGAMVTGHGPRPRLRQCLEDGRNRQGAGYPISPAVEDGGGAATIMAASFVISSSLKHSSQCSLSETL